MLSNPNFVSKAPEKKINEEKAKQAKYQQMMDDAIEEAQEHGVTVYRDMIRVNLSRQFSQCMRRLKVKGTLTRASTKIFKNMPLQKRRRSNEDHK